MKSVSKALSVLLSAATAVSCLGVTAASAEAPAGCRMRVVHMTAEECSSLRAQIIDELTGMTARERLDSGTTADYDAVWQTYLARTEACAPEEDLGMTVELVSLLCGAGYISRAEAERIVADVADGGKIPDEYLPILESEALCDFMFFTSFEEAAARSGYSSEAWREMHSVYGELRLDLLNQYELYTIVTGRDGSSCISYVSPEYSIERIPVYTETASFPEAPQKPGSGDITDDGFVNMADAVTLNRYIAEDSTLEITAEGLANADLNADGSIDALDSAALLRSVSE